MFNEFLLETAVNRLKYYFECLKMKRLNFHVGLRIQTKNSRPLITDAFIDRCRLRKRQGLPFKHQITEVVDS